MGYRISRQVTIQVVKVQGLEKDFGSSQAFKAGYVTWEIGIPILERQEMNLTVSSFAMDAGGEAWRMCNLPQGHRIMSY